MSNQRQRERERIGFSFTVYNNRGFQRGIRRRERDRRPTDESLHSIIFIYETIEHSRDSSKDEVHRKFVGVNRV